MKKLDLSNERFHRLLVMYPGEKKCKKTTWVCQCDCGSIVTVITNDLTSGNTKSCGCYNKDRISNLNKTHGLSNTRLYAIWCSMISRCYNEHNINSKNYMGRNIKICDDWLNDFTEFYYWSLSNGYEENLEIDRINNSGNYEPSNCRWTNRTIQSNNKRTNRILEYNGEKLTLTMMAKKYNINPSTLRSRLRKGMSVDKAITYRR